MLMFRTELVSITTIESKSDIRAGVSHYSAVADMSPDLHCNLCNHCYILGMPDPRPDMRCVQYLSEVH